MQDVVEQVMRAYGLMVNLTPEEEQAARDRLEQFLKDKSVPDAAFQICWLSAERIARNA